MQRIGPTCRKENYAMSDNGTSHITSETIDRILVVRMNRPEKKNALTQAMYTTLCDLIEGGDANDQIRAMLITGVDTSFTSGNDVMDFMNAPPDGDSPVARFLGVLANTRKPLIAAVNGIAIGIGTTMLLHCDLAYAARGAKFQMPFVNLGLCPEAGSSYLLPELMGLRRASELILLGERFDAATAERLGIVNEAVEDAALFDHALGKARRLADQPPASVRISKALLKQGHQAALAAAMADEGRHFFERLTSMEAAEAFQAFAMKRKPDFSAFS